MILTGCGIVSLISFKERGQETSFLNNDSFGAMPILLPWLKSNLLDLSSLSENLCTSSTGWHACVKTGG